MNSSPSTSDGTLQAFKDYAETQAAATVRALIAQAAKPALAELDALRAALDVRCESLTSTLAGGHGNFDADPLRDLVERLTQAAGEEAGAAARAARALASEEADVRLQLDRAEAQKQLDALHAEAEEARHAGRLEVAALTLKLESATQQAEAVRADRDAQLEALRAAREQAEGLRVDRDAQLEALRAANAQADALRADRDAQLAALQAAAEQVAAMGAERDAHGQAARVAKEDARRVQSEQDALLEAARISNARHTKLLEQAEARADAAQAQAAAAQTKAAEAQTLADSAHAELAAAHAQAEAAQAQFVAAQAQLTAAQDALEAAQAETERRLAIGAREIEALRLELERVRVELQTAREAAVATERPIETLLEPATEAPVALIVEPSGLEPETEHQTTSAPDFPIALEAVRELPALHLVEPAETVSAPPEVAAIASEPLLDVEPAPPAEPVPAAVEQPAALDPVHAMCEAINEAADLSQVLDALIDGAGTLFPRAALFVVKARSKRLQGWRSIGFTGPAAITKEFEFPLTTDSALTRTVTANRTIFTGDGEPATQNGEAWTVTFPVTTGGRVVAVVHADAGGRNGESTHVFDRAAALDSGHTIVRVAGERIGVLTMSARAAFGTVMQTAPAPAPVAPALATPADPVGDSAAPQAQIPFSETRVAGAPAPQPAPAGAASLEDAGRYASQLVSELNRYNLTAAAPPGNDIQQRLAGQLEGAGTKAAPASSPAAGTALGLFEDALGKMLGNGTLEPSASIQPV